MQQNTQKNSLTLIKNCTNFHIGEKRVINFGPQNVSPFHSTSAPPTKQSAETITNQKTSRLPPMPEDIKAITAVPEQYEMVLIARNLDPKQGWDQLALKLGSKGQVELLKQKNKDKTTKDLIYRFLLEWVEAEMGIDEGPTVGRLAEELWSIDHKMVQKWMKIREMAADLAIKVQKMERFDKEKQMEPIKCV